MKPLHLSRFDKTNGGPGLTRREFGTAALAGAAGLAFGRQDLRPEVRVNGKRVNAHLEQLSQFGKNPQGGVSRVAYSEADRQAREYVAGLMVAARLQVTVDAAANIIGRRRGEMPDLPPLVMGSHIDSVPEGGNYDGDVGSMGAIEVAQTIAERNEFMRRSIEVIIFANEEGGTIGSHALSGELSEK
jgi:N-carbamoyl-L-amino-acid hydrolase